MNDNISHKELLRRGAEEIDSWPSLSVTWQQIIEEVPSLVQELKTFDRESTIALLSSLQTIPDLQAQGVRLEVMVALAVLNCNGSEQASFEDASRWFLVLGESNCSLGEDAPEDVFVSLLMDGLGDYRLLEGRWESASFYTQRFLDIVNTMPDDGYLGRIKRAFRGLIVLSDAICEKSQLHRYQLGAGSDRLNLSNMGLNPSSNIHHRVLFTQEELEILGIDFNDLKMVALSDQLIVDSLSQEVGASNLEEYPIYILPEERILVCMPSVLSISARLLVLNNAHSDQWIDVIDEHFRESTSLCVESRQVLGCTLGLFNAWSKNESSWHGAIDEQVDKGHILSFHFLLPSINIHKNIGFKQPWFIDEHDQQRLEESINRTVSHYAEQPGFVRGIVLVVICGWGNGFALGRCRVDDARWHVETVSVADLIRLSSYKTVGPDYIFRILHSLKKSWAHGARIANMSGLLNLIGWLDANEQHMVPHTETVTEHFSKDQPLLISIPHDMLLSVRHTADTLYDRHSAIDPNGKRHHLLRATPAATFFVEGSQNVYGSYTDIGDDKYTVVYEGGYSLWVSISTPNMIGNRTALRFLEMLHEWLPRIGTVFDKLFVSHFKHNWPKVNVVFLDSDPLQPNAVPTFDEGRALCKIKEEGKNNVIDVIFDAGYVDLFRDSINTGERIFVETLVCGLLRALGNITSERQVADIVNDIVPNDQARSFHLWQKKYYLDHVKDSLPERLVLIESLENASIRMGLAWYAIEPGQTHELLGRKSCTHFLSKIVDGLIEEVSTALKPYARIPTIARILANNEKAEHDRNHWERSSTALVGLHGNSHTTTDIYIKRRSAISEAGTCSRVLSEMALCECGSSGRMHISNIELRQLLAIVSLIIRIGGQSDAIHYNVLKPRLVISGFGDILFEDEFGDTVVEPMLYKVIGDGFHHDSMDQSSNYNEPTLSTGLRTTLGEEFWKIWTLEMGFDPEQAQKMIEAIEDLGCESGHACLVLRRSKLESTISSAIDTPDITSKFIDRFTLASRLNWTDIPNGFEGRDIYPWRFGRRLSVVSRPIVCEASNGDPWCIVCPGLLRLGFAYLLEGTFSGTLDQEFFTTHEMRNIWWGKASEGHTFNAMVAERMSNAGWKVGENLKLSEVLNAKQSADWGDVDVLAWKHDRTEILVVEVKDLSLARNYSEVASMLAEFQGKLENGKPDRLLRHLNRVTRLKNEVDQVSKFTGTINPKIVSCLVCRGTVPMQYAKIPALSESMVGNVEDLLKQYN